MRAMRAVVVFGALAACALVASAADGDKPTETSVQWALRWLKNHQAPDGHWDAKSFGSMCKLNLCDGAGDMVADSKHAQLPTGLGLLAFLGAGETNEHGTNKATVANALKYLRGAQDAQGFCGDPTLPDALVAHAVAALALTESYGMAGTTKHQATAQQAVNALAVSPAANGPWRADFAKDGAVDAKALPWIVCVLKSAEMSRLDVDVDAMKRVVAWFETRTDASTGAVTDPATKRADDALTATGVLARAFVGRTPKTDPAMAAAAATLAKSAAFETATPMTRHFTALALFLAASDAERARWHAAAKAALEKSQRMEPGRDERGSWDPKDDASKSAGRLVATALSCLTLQVVSRR
jgi:hypothetical protein